MGPSDMLAVAQAWEELPGSMRNDANHVMASKFALLRLGRRRQAGYLAAALSPNPQKCGSLGTTRLRAHDVAVQLESRQGTIQSVHVPACGEDNH